MFKTPAPSIIYVKPGPKLIEIRWYLQGLYMIRYHSLYPWHHHGDYDHLCNETDREMLPWVQKFRFKFQMFSFWLLYTVWLYARAQRNCPGFQQGVIWQQILNSDDLPNFTTELLITYNSKFRLYTFQNSCIGFGDTPDLRMIMELKKQGRKDLRLTFLQ